MIHDTVLNELCTLITRLNHCIFMQNMVLERETIIFKGLSLPSKIVFVIPVGSVLIVLSFLKAFDLTYMATTLKGKA